MNNSKQATQTERNIIAATAAIVVVAFGLLAAKAWAAVFGEAPSWVSLETDPEFKVIHTDYLGQVTNSYSSFDEAVAAQEALHENATGRHTNTVLYSTVDGVDTKVHYKGNS